MESEAAPQLAPCLSQVTCHCGIWTSSCTYGHEKLACVQCAHVPELCSSEFWNKHTSHSSPLKSKAVFIWKAESLCLVTWAWKSNPQKAIAREFSVPAWAMQDTWRVGGGKEGREGWKEAFLWFWAWGFLARMLLMVWELNISHCFSHVAGVFVYLWTLNSKDCLTFVVSFQFFSYDLLVL